MGVLVACGGSGVSVDTGNRDETGISEYFFIWFSDDNVREAYMNRDRPSNAVDEKTFILDWKIKEVVLEAYSPAEQEELEEEITIPPECEGMDEETKDWSGCGAAISAAHSRVERMRCQIRATANDDLDKAEDALAQGETVTLSGFFSRLSDAPIDHAFRYFRITNCNYVRIKVNS